MSHLPLVCFAIVLIYIAATLATYIRSAIRLRRLARLSQSNLIQRLHPVPLHAIREIALADLQTSCDSPAHDSVTLWRMLGEARGVSQMIENTEIMIALASYMERWNSPEAAFEAARMRMDAALLRRATARLGKSVLAANSMHVALYAHEAAITYYRMTERLRNGMAIDLQRADAV